MKWSAFLLFAPLSLFAAELPEPVIPAGVGVNIHFVRGHERDLELIEAAGFKFVRMDFDWNAIERKKGEYNWSDYDELTLNLERHGLRAIYIFDYSNPLYEEKVESQNALKTDIKERDTGSPQHPGSIGAYAAWAAASAKHFHGHHIVWEIWNEPNGFFWKPKPDAAQYSALAVAAAKAVREAEPDATIIGPALSGFEPPFMDTFLKSGVLEYVDAVSVHPYRSPKQWPETAEPDYKKLREKIAQYAPAGKTNMPILSGEWGYSTAVGHISPETQAAYLVRQQLFNLLNGIPLSIWYDWKNDGTDALEVEHNFGTVTDKLEPKPAYEAIKMMTHELAGYRIERRIETAPQDFVLVFTNSSGVKKLAAWTTRDAHTISIKPVQGEVPDVSGIGVVIALEQLPKYLNLK
jgi:hypothetical protein